MVTSSRCRICMIVWAAVLELYVPTAIAAEPTIVKVVMTEYKFIPDHLELSSGVRYRLHLENAGAELHQFTAPAFFQSTTIENPEVLNADHTDVVLQPHQSKDVIFVPRRRGSYSLVCADHDWAGMVGHITVKKRPSPKLQRPRQMMSRLAIAWFHHPSGGSRSQPYPCRSYTP